MWEFQREGELKCCKGKGLPDRQEKSRRLSRLNNVLLNAEMRSISALKVQVSIRPPIYTGLCNHWFAVTVKFTDNFTGFE